VVGAPKPLCFSRIPRTGQRQAGEGTHHRRAGRGNSPDRGEARGRQHLFGRNVAGIDASRTARGRPGNTGGGISQLALPLAIAALLGAGAAITYTVYRGRRAVVAGRPDVPPGQLRPNLQSRMGLCPPRRRWPYRFFPHPCWIRPRPRWPRLLKLCWAQPAITYALPVPEPPAGVIPQARLRLK